MVFLTVDLPNTLARQSQEPELNLIVLCWSIATFVYVCWFSLFAFISVLACCCCMLDEAVETRTIHALIVIGGRGE